MKVNRSTVGERRKCSVPKMTQELEGFHCNLTSMQVERLRKLADVNDVAVSWLARRAIAEFLDRIDKEGLVIETKVD